MTDQTTVELAAEAERFKRDYLNACKTIADMHAAATGYDDRGPERGVVEDVADVRARMLAAEAAIERVRALHRQEHGCCAHCTSAIAEPYPCPTIRELDGPPAPAVTEGTEPVLGAESLVDVTRLADQDGEPLCTCTYGERCPNCRD